MLRDVVCLQGEEETNKVPSVARLGFLTVGIAMLGGLCAPSVHAALAFPQPVIAAVALSTATKLKPAAPDNWEINQAMERAAARRGVPAEVLKAVAWQESGWNHTKDGHVLRNANRDRHGRVLSHDWGIFQINDSTQKAAFPRAKTDIYYNIDYAARLLKSLYQENGTWEGAIRAYNGSASYLRSVQKWRHNQPWQTAVKRDAARHLSS